MISLAAALCVLAASSVVAAGPASAASAGFRVLDGREAAAFRVPADVRLVRTWRDEARGLTYERYQQYAQPFGAHVDGAQLTVVRRGPAIALVIGAHYPLVSVRNRVVVDGMAAIGRALANSSLLNGLSESVRGELVSRTDLRLDPTTGRLFQHVESSAPGVRLFHVVDAETGAILDSWDAIDHASPGMGTGVRSDRKSLLGEAGSGDNLTKFIGGAWRMQTAGPAARMSTYDAKNSDSYRLGMPLMNDNGKPAWANNNDWAAAYQRAAVDAQYYGRLTDSYYLDPANVGGFDFLNSPCVDGAGAPTTSPSGPISNVVHFDDYPFDNFGYDNAFWDGEFLVYGDGDGVTTGPFAGAQDIVSHEMTHAVTECRAPLHYSRQSGALNEAISDIMAMAIEWQFNEPTSSNCRREAGQTGCPDWWVGEDAIIGGSSFGFRNIEDPATVDQPSHWDDRWTSSWDNYGVHINSTIPSHAFYLMVNGGRNSRCEGAFDGDADCDVVVPAIPITDATEISFAAWGTLPNPVPSSSAGSDMFCNAHDASVAEAELLFPGSEAHRAAAELGWAAVGRSELDCHPSPVVGDFSISMARRSIALAPGGSGQFAVSLARGEAMEDVVDFSVRGAAPATKSLTPESSPGVQPNDGTVLQIDVPADMAGGVYPLVVSASDGSRTRYASVVLVVDGTAPLVSVSQVHLDTNGQISAAGVTPLRVTWSAADAASGLASAVLQASATGAAGTWRTVASGNDGTVTVIAGDALEWFRVSAKDGVGNRAISDASGPWGIGRFQEGSATYTGPWSALPASQNWGAVRHASESGATAKFVFTGTEVAWISSRGPNRGKAKVFLDGVLLAKVDLYGSTASPRRVAFTAVGLAAGPHTLKVIVSGTSGRPRVDVDGFVVLSQPSP